MTRTVKSYFEHHANDYANRHIEFYDFLVDYIRNMRLKNTTKLLDIGCGDGGFVRSLLSANIKFDYFLTDLSYEMARLAKINTLDSNSSIFVADALNLPLSENIKFDIIHIDSVFHHLIDKTKERSVKMVHQMVDSLSQRLSFGGLLIVDEWYFLSYIIPSFASSLIFYGLKLINLLKLDLSFFGEIKPGLEANFLEPEKLLHIFSKYGNASLLRRTKEEFPVIYKYFLIKEKGRVSCILKRDNNGDPW